MKNLLVAVAAVLALQCGLASGAHAAPAGPPVLKGTVLETIDVDPYTYLRLKTADGEVWAAVSKAAVKKGAEVTIRDPAVMQNFQSKTLKRTFPTIVFGTLGAPATAGTAPSAASPSAGSPPPGATLGQIHGGAAKGSEVAVAKVAKAEGPTGRTVAEVNAQRSVLKDKPVAVRATVVKVNPNVMGKNWVHLRDGSGSAGDGSNDLLATSKGEPKVGDVVVAKGIVKTDVDLGAGYAYKVLVENATFSR